MGRHRGVIAGIRQLGPTGKWMFWCTVLGAPIGILLWFLGPSKKAQETAQESLDSLESTVFDLRDQVEEVAPEPMEVVVAKVGKVTLEAQTGSSASIGAIKAPAGDSRTYRVEVEVGEATLKASPGSESCIGCITRTSGEAQAKSAAPAKSGWSEQP